MKWHHVLVTDAEKKDDSPREPELTDGRYDVVVVDIAVAPDANVDPQPDGSSPPAPEAGEPDSGTIEVSIAIEVVITDGPNKGDVVTVEFSGAISEADALEALGVPGVLTV